MRLHRFHISELIGVRNEIVLNDAELIHQIRNVFRLKNGSEIILFDDSGLDYICRIENIEKDSLIVSVAQSSPSRFLPATKVALYSALVKKDTFEWIAEKATELGVSEIIPIIAGRSEKKSLNEIRLRKIILEASEQSGRGNVPELRDVITFKEAITSVSDKKIPSIAFHTDGPKFESESFMKHSAGRIAIFIGPEGGWSPEEVDMFHKNGIQVFSLGPQILRAETAVVAALSLTLLGK